MEEVCPAAADVNGMVKNDDGGVRYVNTNSGGSFSSLSMSTFVVDLFYLSWACIFPLYGLIWGEGRPLG